MFKASFAMTVSLVVALALTSAPADADPPFEEGAQAAVAAADPGLRPSENGTLQGQSLLDPAQSVKIDQATFRAPGKVVAVVRTVGAVPVVDGDTAVGRVLRTEKVERARVGGRKVIISTTADRYGPGLTVATWTERTGVNYRVSSREALTRAQLIKIIKELPADGTQVSRKAKSTIKSRRVPRPVEPRSASSLYVDGAGDVSDDWGDEGTLCNGCSYSNSNYTFMWQKVLWADSRLAAGSIDCAFGSQTASATANWQSWMGISADGIVGSTTRGRADNYLLVSDTTTVFYQGDSVFMSFVRNSTNNRYMMNGRYFGYTYTTLC